MNDTMNNEITIYLASCTGNKFNTGYPLEFHIKTAEDLAAAVRYDHVSAKYADGFDADGNLVIGYRGKDRFLEADNICMDCDNTDVGPEDYMIPDDVREAFPGVVFYAVPSRNHMRRKEGDAPRPKYHYYFPTKKTFTDADAWAALKRGVQKHFPAFDSNALDAGRFIYGVDDPKPEHFAGELCIDEYMEMIKAEKTEKDNMPGKKVSYNVIPEGTRNSALNHIAGILLTKYGAEDGRAAEEFAKEAKKCEPPLSSTELNAAWSSALKFYRERVLTRPDYVTPEQYKEYRSGDTYEPADYTDVGQANVFYMAFGDIIRYTNGTGELVYGGKVWEESKTKMRALSQALTELQLKEARKRVTKAQGELNKAIESGAKDRITEAKAVLAREERYRKYVLGRRKSSSVEATIKEVIPKIEIMIDQLDADGYLLNTPEGAVDLRTGQVRPNDPLDYCTKITSVAPDMENYQLFMEFLDKLTVGDKDLERYLQEVAGMCAVGHVLKENLIIAYGEGGNGKSTLFNLLSRVLGDYSGSLSAEILTSNCRKNKSPELAELRGKRIVIAAELDEGTRLDTGIVKRLCSVDPIQVEKKYRDPFSFIPSHTAILYTNHLPKVGTMDKGTWDRLIVVPFLANFRGMKGEIFNYGDYLYENCGGAVLAWIIEGAKRFIANDYNIALPKCVSDAIRQYRESNDWLDHFLDECCEIDVSYKEKSGDLYKCYRSYCESMGDYIRSLADFKQALREAGYETRKTNKGAMVHGLRIAPDDDGSCPTW